jgi:PAS domain S-box-containing protein
MTIFCTSLKNNKMNSFITSLDTKQALREALIRSEERYELITKNMSDLLSWQDMNGNFTFLSPSVSSFLGYDEEELIGVNAQDIIFITDKPKVKEVFRSQFKENNYPIKLTYRILHKEGKYIWVESRLQPLFNSKEVFIGSQAVTRDITAHKLAQQEIKRNIVKEKELNELRTKFIAMASHQFRTPLTVIRSNMELLSMLMENVEGKAKSKFSKINTRIDAQITKMTSLMEDVMLLGKLEEGKTPFLPKKQDIVSWFNTLIQTTFSNEQDGRFVDFDKKVDFLEVEFDDKILGHTLLNLISNAFKYSQNSGENPKVVIEENDGSVIFAITDKGIGIPKTEQDNLFQSFYRANNTAGIQGTGLGLVIAKEFVEMHKGIIVFESEVDHGTTFWVSIPIELKQ